MDKFDNIKKLITNTPLIEITYKYNNKINTATTKCEWYSLTGSIKDKVAFNILKTAYDEGKLKKGDKIVEVSSGNMGISISAIGGLLGNPVTILMPKNMSEERKKLIKLYGATLIETEDFPSAFKLCDEMEKEGYYSTRQFENKANTIAHRDMTAKEIIDKADHINATTFVAGIGTSGTLSGVGGVLKEKLGLKTITIEPDNARIITANPPYGHHQLQGLSDEILPDLFIKNLCDKVVQITDNDAIAMSRKLSKDLALAVGISSGANFLGCVLSGEKAITIFPDDNKKYLSTDLSKDINTPLVDNIELISFRVL